MNCILKKISNEGNNLGFKIEYNKDSKLINKLSNESIDCFSYTIEDLENKKTFDKKYGWKWNYKSANSF